MKLPTTKVVYLAGGMKGVWHDAVMVAVHGPLYVDPRRHGLGGEEAYTRWDLTGVQKCDIVFALLEADNPSGYGLALEVGVAAALGKYVIFVEEPDHPKTRYFGMVRECSDVVVDSCAKGIEELKLAINN